MALPENFDPRYINLENSREFHVSKEPQPARFHIEAYANARAYLASSDGNQAKMFAREALERAYGDQNCQLNEQSFTNCSLQHLQRYHGEDKHFEAACELVITAIKKMVY